jgi:hypothetical protein
MGTYYIYQQMPDRPLCPPDAVTYTETARCWNCRQYFEVTEEETHPYMVGMCHDCRVQGPWLCVECDGPQVAHPDDRCDNCKTNHTND